MVTEAMVTGKVPAEPWFSGAVRTAQVRNWYAAKPNKTLHTLLAQGFVPEFLESIKVREAWR